MSALHWYRLLGVQSVAQARQYSETVGDINNKLIKLHVSRRAGV